MKIIIFEGIDKIGKSTTISNLTSEFKERGLTPILLSPSFILDSCHKSNILSEFRLRLSFDDILKMCKFFDDKHVLLIDRFHLSEFVYSKVLREEQPINGFELNYIDYYLNQNHAMLVYQTTNQVGKLFEKYKDENGLLDNLTYEQYIKSHVLFEEQFDQSVIVDKFKFDREDYEAAKIKILNHIIGF